MQRLTLLTMLLALIVPVASGGADIPDAPMWTSHGPEVSADVTSLKSALSSLTARQKALVTGVDCDAGEQLSSVIGNRNRANLVIWFTGTCVEPNELRIERDDVTIRGFGDAVVNGGFGIYGASRIHFRDFSIIDPPSGLPGIAGIFARAANGLILQRIEVVNGPQRGMLIEQSTLTVQDVSIRTEDPDLVTEVGLLNRGSRIWIVGTLQSSGANLAGISATLVGSYFLNGGMIDVSNNRGSGAFFQIGSGVTISNGIVLANNNGTHGLVIANETPMLHGAVQIEANDNGAVGMLLTDYGSFANFSGFAGQISASRNGLAGIGLQDGSSASLTGPITINDNGQFGLLADQSEITLNGVTAEGNGLADGAISFGSRASFFDGNTFGTLFCDSTVLLRSLTGGEPPECVVVNNATAKALAVMRGTLENMAAQLQ